MASTPEVSVQAPADVLEQRWMHYIESQMAAHINGRALIADGAFLARVEANLPHLLPLYVSLYGDSDIDTLPSVSSLIQKCGELWLDRHPDLKDLDKGRGPCHHTQPCARFVPSRKWFQSNKMLGGVCYVDLYATSLYGLRSKIPYFKELGLTYLHLMPLFDSPEPRNDGGYAVSSYRRAKPKLGIMEDLRDLARELRVEGISLCLDLVVNHTSNEHEWARRAMDGEKKFEEYYWIFPDREGPDVFEKTTREIFPDDHPGSFVQLPDGRWVWSTFYRFQWDLNYSNPKVFEAMAVEMLYLANVGVEIFRLDAVAFMWKEEGTTCESLPQVHTLLKLFNIICRIAAPSVLFKSEAIVHPDDVVSYIDSKECQLSYNPLQMALTWEARHSLIICFALATRDVSFLSQAIGSRHYIAQGCAWINYVRSHDDIGWTFADEDAAELGIHGQSHRRFLNNYFVNRHPGSFARGLPFQDNPKTGDCRISGTTASLCGLEAGEAGSIERILLVFSVAMSTGGIPLIYLGDEVGQLNDYSYRNDPSKKDDSRWVHRPEYPEQRYSERLDPSTTAAKLYNGLRQLIRLRKDTDEFAGGIVMSFDTGNKAVLGYLRPSLDKLVLCLANFSDDPQNVAPSKFKVLPYKARDLVSGEELRLRQSGIRLEAQHFAWLRYEA